MNKYMHLIYSKEYMKTYENGLVRNKFIQNLRHGSIFGVYLALYVLYRYEL